jgi:hypothetical protein
MSQLLPGLGLASPHLENPAPDRNTIQIAFLGKLIGSLRYSYFQA